MKETKLPHSIEAEQSVLGAAFISKYALQKICEEITRESFYLEKHAQIYDVINELAINNVPIDIRTVTDKIKNKKQLSQVGGVDYLFEIANSVPSAANIDFYINIVHEKALLRNLIEVTTNIVTNAYDGDININELLDESERKILSVVRNRKSSEFRKIQEILAKTQADLEKLAETAGEVTGIPSGFGDIDRITSGFHGNEFIVLASRPGMGKTAFSLNVGTSVATSTNKTVAIFNLEMSAEQLAIRMISSLGQVPMNKLRTGRLEHNDWKRINEAISQLADTNIYVDDTPGVTIGEIKAKCRRLASSSLDLGMVIIDYLQLVSSTNRYAGNRQQEVSEISRSLKTLAMELDVPVIALAQLSRAVESREEKRPLMSDLRESGSIEQDADIVAFLYRDDYYNKEARRENFNSESEFIIAKNRHGPTATIDLLFKKDTGTFLSYKKEDES
ncbi:MAG: replicative DNA helicase [Bacilli bacterium]|jgi:replicative DNA helicase|nr:replicative DNA helicase [Bacilli bacterium]